MRGLNNPRYQEEVIAVTRKTIEHHLARPLAFFFPIYRSSRCHGPMRVQTILETISSASAP